MKLVERDRLPCLLQRARAPPATTPARAFIRLLLSGLTRATYCARARVRVCAVGDANTCPLVERKIWKTLFCRSKTKKKCIVKNHRHKNNKIVVVVVPQNGFSSSSRWRRRRERVFPSDGEPIVHARVAGHVQSVERGRWRDAEDC